MNTRLLSSEELRKRMFSDDGADDEAEVETRICTIAELFDLAELVRKGKYHKLPKEFSTATRNALNAGDICIESLDLDRLHRNMFNDHRDQKPVLWPPANDPAVPVGKTVRRLILRPSEVTWWDDDVFEQMEQTP